MRRYVFLILWLVVLALPFGLRWAVSGETLVAPAAKRLVVVTPHNQDIRREFARAFSQWYREKYNESVAIDYRMPGGANDIKRVLETTYRAYLDKDGNFKPDMPVDIDVVWGGGDYFFDRELAQLFQRSGKRIGVLEPIDIDPALLRETFPDPTLAGVKLYDTANPRPLWVGVCVASYGIVYNPDLYQSLGLSAPAKWEDLTDPKLSGLVALADPAHSGAAAVAYMVVIQRAMADAENEIFARLPELRSLPKPDLYKRPEYLAALSTGWKTGMSRLLLIAANARYFTASATQVPNDVGRADAAAGLTIDFYGRVYQEIVGPARCRFVSPIGATSITPDPVGILRGVKGERKQLADRFVEFLLTKEAQRLWNLKAGEPGGPEERALRRLPIRRDIYADRSGWADADVDPFTLAQGFNQRAEWMTLFSDTRPIWVCAWIDCRDTLKDAYKKILAVQDNAARTALLVELADLPISMQDVANLQSTRQKLDAAHVDVELWKAQQRIELNKRFREHYQRVGAKAG